MGTLFQIAACRLFVADVGKLHMLRYMLMQETWPPLPWSMQLREIDNYGYRCEAQQDRIMPNTFIGSK